MVRRGHAEVPDVHVNILYIIYNMYTTYELLMTTKFDIMQETYIICLSDSSTTGFVRLITFYLPFFLLVNFLFSHRHSLLVSACNAIAFPHPDHE